jgi:hypothetical protein
MTLYYHHFVKSIENPAVQGTQMIQFLQLIVFVEKYLFKIRLKRFVVCHSIKFIVSYGSFPLIQDLIFFLDADFVLLSTTTGSM